MKKSLFFSGVFLLFVYMVFVSVGDMKQPNPLNSGESLRLHGKLLPVCFGQPLHGHSKCYDIGLQAVPKNGGSLRLHGKLLPVCFGQPLHGHSKCYDIGLQAVPKKI